MEKGLPIGCAPNVHVSLVLLPEECAGLSPRRFPWQSLKLKAMGAVFARQFESRVGQDRPAISATTPGADAATRR
jgi:hypothetical protein